MAYTLTAALAKLARVDPESYGLDPWSSNAQGKYDDERDLEPNKPGELQADSVDEEPVKGHPQGTHGFMNVEKRAAEDGRDATVEPVARKHIRASTERYDAGPLTTAVWEPPKPLREQHDPGPKYPNDLNQGSLEGHVNLKQPGVNAHHGAHMDTGQGTGKVASEFSGMPLLVDAIDTLSDIMRIMNRNNVGGPHKDENREQAMQTPGVVSMMPKTSNEMLKWAASGPWDPSALWDAANQPINEDVELPPPEHMINKPNPPVPNPQYLPQRPQPPKEYSGSDLPFLNPIPAPDWHVAAGAAPTDVRAYTPMKGPATTRSPTTTPYGNFAFQPDTSKSPAKKALAGGSYTPPVPEQAPISRTQQLQGWKFAPGAYDVPGSEMTNSQQRRFGEQTLNESYTGLRQAPNPMAADPNFVKSHVNPASSYNKPGALQTEHGALGTSGIGSQYNPGQAAADARYQKAYSNYQAPKGSFGTEQAPAPAAANPAPQAPKSNYPTKEQYAATAANAPAWDDKKYTMNKAENLPAPGKGIANTASEAMLKWAADQRWAGPSESNRETPHVEPPSNLPVANTNATAINAQPVAPAAAGSNGSPGGNDLALGSGIGMSGGSSSGGTGTTIDNSSTNSTAATGSPAANNAFRTIKPSASTSVGQGVVKADVPSTNFDLLTPSGTDNAGAATAAALSQYKPPQTGVASAKTTVGTPNNNPFSFNKPMKKASSELLKWANSDAFEPAAPEDLSGRKGGGVASQSNDPTGCEIEEDAIEKVEALKPSILQKAYRDDDYASHLGVLGATKVRSAMDALKRMTANPAAKLPRGKGVVQGLVNKRPMVADAERLEQGEANRAGMTIQQLREYLNK